MKLIDLLKENYGGEHYELPHDHKAAMKVPKGGACCANCKWWDRDSEHCDNEYYEMWNGGKEIHDRADHFCSDWWEPIKH